jgi:hypothetical protein
LELQRRSSPSKPNPTGGRKRKAPLPSPNAPAPLPAPRPAGRPAAPLVPDLGSGEAMAAAQPKPTKRLGGMAEALAIAADLGFPAPPPQVRRPPSPTAPPRSAPPPDPAAQPLGSVRCVPPPFNPDPTLPIDSGSFVRRKLQVLFALVVAPGGAIGERIVKCRFVESRCWACCWK